jgi:outer membrane putative beta-barrel porin/alpha-amylase
MKRSAFALLGLLAAAPLAAQDLSGLPEPLVTDRPDFTESTSTVPPGHFQVEGGATFTRLGDEESQSLGEILLRVGAGERWEARLGIGSFSRIDPGLPGTDTISGFEDAYAGLKVRLTEDDPDLLPPGHPAIALLLATTVPVGDDELTSDEWQPEAKLALSWDLTPRLSLASNLNYAYPADGPDRFHQLAASLTAGLSLTDRVGLYLEGFGFSKESADGSSTSYVNSGLTFLLSNDLQLDVRAGAGLDDPHPNWFAGLGAAVRF